jgi:hypothetical protein
MTTDVRITIAGMAKRKIPSLQALRGNPEELLKIDNSLLIKTDNCLPLKKAGGLKGFMLIEKFGNFKEFL